MVLWVDPLHLPSLGAISLVEEEISRFKFFMWPHKTAKRHVTPWVACYNIRYVPAKSGGIDFVKKEILYFQFNKWSLVITWSELSDFTMGFTSPNVSPLQSFGGHTSSEGRNIWLLVCHVTCDQVFRGTSDFLRRS